MVGGKYDIRLYKFITGNTEKRPIIRRFDAFDILN